ncbi:MAG: GDP-mannose 4,6-dehydratase [Candidatus Manganitrophus sp. SA1]|nr:GDP-mannose 4,6-dehydratase [Candidatus Manganitrophus morganii]
MINGKKERPVLITGGAGFVGTNLAHRLLQAERPVLIFDNLSRAGVEQNLRWLRERHGSRLQVTVADVRNAFALQRAVRQAASVFHFAAQVAVTTSLAEPIDDFEVNARGTLNLLEAIRVLETPPPLLFTSTNKVYGELENLPLRQGIKRYEPEAPEIRTYGIGESRPLEFHSPYGCSKGAADQYVLDYARTYGIPAAVFRMSCIYGPHQFGTEDQGWVAHFMIRAMESRPITLFGDGRQVRDVLYVEDLIDAFLLAQGRIDSLSGEAFNIGGGPSNTTSLLELIHLIETIGERPLTTHFEPWRLADQRYYVSDTRRFQAATGWFPRVGVEKGVRSLYAWLREDRSEKPALRGARARSASQMRSGRAAGKGAA